MFQSDVTATSRHPPPKTLSFHDFTHLLSGSGTVDRSLAPTRFNSISASGARPIVSPLYPRTRARKNSAAVASIDRIALREKKHARQNARTFVKETKESEWAHEKSPIKTNECKYE